MKNKEKRMHSQSKDNKCNVCDVIQEFNVLKKDNEGINQFIEKSSDIFVEKTSF